VVEQQVAVEKLKELEGLQEKLIAAVNRFVMMQIYENALTAYEASYETFVRQKEELDQLKEKVEQLKAARKAVAQVRTRVKTYLIPSLNRVASSLLTQMTDGERNSILIQEDFDILVDGQPVHTLSGSGKAVANIALRIGLGQVLTHNVFPIFLADEIDAAMDEKRARLTSVCLSRLSQTISQVVIVSHKRPDADHYIELTQ
jgi:DNA repair exonuclease SbcCD ATPase subunit